MLSPLLPLGKNMSYKRGGGFPARQATFEKMCQKVQKIALFPMILIQIREISGYKRGGGLRARQATSSQIGLKKGGT